MRKLPVMLVAAFLFTAGTLFANDSETTDPKKDLAIQIGDLLEDNTFVLKEKDLTAKVLFTLNHKNEIVVISVDTNDEVLERFVKSRLNYKVVEAPVSKEGTMFTVPVRITG
ncbi:MAG: hypothetical protein KJO16_01640 [Muriicola sp.]|nr:hypothetical protein [Muriicola sp.]MBT8283227.1 hypothetical protein [Muriicola sp.]NNK11234.1 hypothetical protein [Flavobacteriaceae bacterium]